VYKFEDFVMQTTLQHSLFVASITFLSGGAAFYLIPSGGAASALAGSTAGAAATSVILNRQKRNAEGRSVHEDESVSSIKGTAVLLDQPPRETQYIQVPSSEMLQEKIQTSSSKSTKPAVELPKTIEVKEPISPVLSTQTLSSSASNPVRAWLEKQGIKTIGGSLQLQPKNPLLDDLAIFMANNYLALEPLLKKINANTGSDGGMVEHNLEGEDPNAINTIKIFCNKLNQANFLKEYSLSSEKITLPLTQNAGKGFFEKKWFKRFIYLEIIQLLKNSNLEHQIFVDTNIFIDENQLTQDLFFKVGKIIFCVQCKTRGSYGVDIKTKYLKLIGKIKELQGKIFLVTLNKCTLENEFVDNSDSIVLASKDDFIEKIRTALDIPLPTNQTLLLEDSNSFNGQKETLSCYKNSLNLGFNEAIKWLDKRGFEVTQHYQGESRDRVFDAAALMIGNNYVHLNDLVGQIIYNIKNRPGETVKYSLSNKTKPEINICKQFCERINRFLLTHYNYDSRTNAIYLVPIAEGTVLCFFEGKWFERYVHQAIVLLLSEYKIKHHQLINANFRLDNAIFAGIKDGELDLFFLIENNPFLVECKSGKSDYQKDIQKYDKYSKVLKIQKNSSIYIALNMNDEVRDFLNDTFKFLTVVNSSNYHQALSSAIASLKSAE
jgi:hypothetical protein